MTGFEKQAMRHLNKIQGIDENDIKIIPNNTETIDKSVDETPIICELHGRTNCPDPVCADNI